MNRTFAFGAILAILIFPTAFAATAAKKAPARPVAKTAARPAAPVANRAPAQAVPVKPAPGAPSSRPAATSDAQIANSIRSLAGSGGGGGSLMRSPGSHEIGEAMRVTGQARNLSMGLLFSKDSDKIEFGNPRMHYRDKISPKADNY